MSDTKTAEQKFEEIVKTNQKNIRRLLSNEDHQIGADTAGDVKFMEEIINKTKGSFKAGSSDDLGRTYQYLIDSLSPNANICLICIDTIQKTDGIWSCSCCYSPFHIMCIQKWIIDGIYQWSSTNNTETSIWHCPKCRTEFHQKDKPKRYFCYCQKEIDPPFDPWLLPHSCGQICGKRLIPECGHTCCILCHPGPCPPCPIQVDVRCYCSRSNPTARRCGYKGWSCGKTCLKILSCGQHQCEQICHAGACSDCKKTSLRTCLCGKTNVERTCSERNFQCDQPCKRLLNCGIHFCERVCHENGCDPCPRQGVRTCPCGKTRYENLPCSEDISTCGDTCDRKLDCGLHRCLDRCHIGSCIPCRQVIVKRCRCGLKEKMVPCCQEYFCDIKCTRMRSCGKHACKRKCCDGNCPLCQTICGKLLNCRNHKCLGECHCGPCYPCTLKSTVTCACGETSMTVPCGSERQTEKPRCNKLCSKPSDCHHQEREPHPCHFNECPPCKQQCNLPLMDCSHLCSVPCHDSVLVKEETNSLNTPWKIKETLTRKSLPCPPCTVSIAVFCFGQHKSKIVSCSLAHPFSCGQLCCRTLKCQNHLCNQPCHLLTGTSSKTEAAIECVQCNEMCSKERPSDCQHSCPLRCHPQPCPPCKERLRMRCHCNTKVVYSDCQTFTTATEAEKEKIKSCQKPCSKRLICGHSCAFMCHSGQCSSVNACSEIVMVRCSCRRLTQELPCFKINTVKNFRLPCDNVCIEVKANRMASKINSTLVQKEIEASKSLNDYCGLLTNRAKKGDQNTDKANRQHVSTKKAKPRRFVWTQNKVVVLFGIFSVTIASLIIYMFKEIA